MRPSVLRPNGDFQRIRAARSALRTPPGPGDERRLGAGGSNVPPPGSHRSRRWPGLVVGLTVTADPTHDIGLFLFQAAGDQARTAFL